MKKIVLRLYVVGKTSRSLKAIHNMKQICSEELAGEADLGIIDVKEHPQLAEDEKIIATPTLVKSLPAPTRRVIGDFSNREKILLLLDLRELEDPR